MSADNYFVVRRHPEGGFVPLMGFASTSGVPVDFPAAQHAFDTPEGALESVLDEYAEYGHGIHPECYRPVRSAYDPSRAAGEDPEVILERCTDALTLTRGFFFSFLDTAGVYPLEVPLVGEWEGELVRVAEVSGGCVDVVVRNERDGSEVTASIPHYALSGEAGARRWAAEVLAEGLA